ncbi:MAG: hypothetical protein HQL31_03605 [Planctomycetes bacterium]|nr:hypothetical protein [Planctomycetota bacterium]
MNSMFVSTRRTVPVLLGALLLVCSAWGGSLGQEGCRDSFSEGTSYWQERLGWIFNQPPSDCLKAQDNLGKPLLLAQELKQDFEISFFVKVPEKESNFGFVLMDEEGLHDYRIEIYAAGKEASDRKDGNSSHKGSRLLKLKGETSDAILYSSARYVKDASWHQIKLHRGAVGTLEVQMDGELLLVGDAPGVMVNFGLWAAGEGAVLFDEFSYDPIPVWREFFSDTSPDVLKKELLEGWEFSGGKWELVHLASLGRQALTVQTGTEQALAVYAGNLPPEYRIEARIRMETAAEAGVRFALAKKGQEGREVILVSGEKSGVAMRQISSGSVSGLWFVPADIQPGIWYKLAIHSDGARIRVSLDNLLLEDREAGLLEGRGFGLLSRGSGLVKFGRLTIEEADTRDHVTTLDDFLPEDIANCDWERDHSFRCTPGIDVGVMDLNRQFNKGMTFEGTLLPGADFARLAINLKSSAHELELNFYAFNKELHASFLHHGIKGTEELGKGPADQESDRYRDSRNAQFKEQGRMLVMDLKSADRVHYAFEFIDDRARMEAYIHLNLNDKIFARIPVNSEQRVGGVFSIDARGWGELSIQQTDLSGSGQKQTPLGFKQSQSLEMTSYNGSWVLRGRTLSDLSLQENGVLAMRDPLFEEGALIFDLAQREQQGGVLRLELGSAKSGGMIQTELDFIQKDRLAMKVISSEGTQPLLEIPVESSGAYLKLVRRGRRFWWYVGDQRVMTFIGDVGPMAQIAFRRMSGKFLLDRISLIHYPTRYSLFENSNSYRRDSSIWQSQRMPLLSSENWGGARRIFRFGKALLLEKQEETDILLTLTGKLEKRFLFSSRNDCKDGAGAELVYGFEGEKTNLTVVIKPEAGGSVFVVSEQDSEIYNQRLEKLEFLLGLLVDGDSRELLVDGRSISKWKQKDGFEVSTMSIKLRGLPERKVYLNQMMFF